LRAELPARPRPRAAIGPVARAVAALLLVASLFSVWRLPGGSFTLLGLDFGGPAVNFGPSDELAQDGWERWGLLDLAFVALALGLLVTTTVHRRALAAVVACGTLTAAAYVLINGFDPPARADTFAQTAAGLQPGPGPGPYLALAALTFAILALAPLLRRPRAPTL